MKKNVFLLLIAFLFLFSARMFAAGEFIFDKDLKAVSDKMDWLKIASDDFVQIKPGENHKFQLIIRESDHNVKIAAPIRFSVEPLSGAKINTQTGLFEVEKQHQTALFTL